MNKTYAKIAEKAGEAEEEMLRIEEKHGENILSKRFKTKTRKTRRLAEEQRGSPVIFYHTVTNIFYILAYSAKVALG